MPKDKLMKRFIASLLVAFSFAGAAFAQEGGPAWDKFPTEKLTDQAALQHGAKLFVNYCLNCHQAAYMRYNRLHDIGLTDDQIKSNLLFAGDKVGDLMKTSLAPQGCQGVLRDRPARFVGDHPFTFRPQWVRGGLPLYLPPIVLPGRDEAHGME